jgi:hypothetical protein
VAIQLDRFAPLAMTEIEKGGWDHPGRPFSLRER